MRLVLAISALVAFAVAGACASAPPRRIVADDACHRCLVVEVPTLALVSGKTVEGTARELVQAGAVSVLPEGSWPKGLVASIHDGPSLAQAKTVFWIHCTRACLAWTVDGGRLVKTETGAEGETFVTSFGLGATSTSVALTGPHNEVVAAPGRKPTSAGASFGCGTLLHVASAGPESITFVTTSGIPLGATIVGYARDSEGLASWYFERSACERAAADGAAAFTICPH